MSGSKLVRWKDDRGKEIKIYEYITVLVFRGRKEFQPVQVKFKTIRRHEFED